MSLASLTLGACGGGGHADTSAAAGTKSAGADAVLAPSGATDPASGSSGVSSDVRGGKDGARTASTDADHGSGASVPVTTGTQKSVGTSKGSPAGGSTPGANGGERSSGGPGTSVHGRHNGQRKVGSQTGHGSTGSSDTGAAAPTTGSPAASSTEVRTAGEASYEVRSLNMEPTYKPYVKLYYDQQDTTPKPGQVVIFNLPSAALEGRCGDNPPPQHACQEAASGLSGTNAAGRVVAVGGESAAFQEGNTIRDAQLQSESSFTKPCGNVPLCNFPDPITVPQGSYYILYDDRNEVDDSRVWGAVPQAAIVGVVNGVAPSS